jgi:hypothetical protein
VLHPLLTCHGAKLASTLGAEPGSVANKIAGGAIKNAVYGAGINGLLAAAQGKDIGRGVALGASSGALGGALGAELASRGRIGKFASENPNLVSGGIGMLASPLIESAVGGNNSAY